MTERESSVRMDVPAWKPYILDQPHNLSAALSARLGWWRVGARVRYVSGGPMPYEGFMLPERLPDYVDLSLRVERGWRRRWGEVHAFVDVQNATNRRNIEDIVSENIGPREIVACRFCRSWDSSTGPCRTSEPGGQRRFEARARVAAAGAHRGRCALGSGRCAAPDRDRGGRAGRRAARHGEGRAHRACRSRGR